MKKLYPEEDKKMTENFPESDQSSQMNELMQGGQNQVNQANLVTFL